MKNLIKNIVNNIDIDYIFTYIIERIYANGAVDISDMEILSYLALYSPEKFKVHQDVILNMMAIPYKQTTCNSLREQIFVDYLQHINETYDHNYTPVQASVIDNIGSYNCFSFSAPTSTGKSFVFMNLIKDNNNDTVIVVPSRALINEYYLKLCNLIEDKSVNILTFIDKINTIKATRNIFIVTPERCRELFKQQQDFNVDLFLFDEAQLSAEKSKRGLYFDSIVRRCQNAYPNAKYVFAHPFIANPDSQIIKNHFEPGNSSAIQYRQRNVGQIFLLSENDEKFHHFGINKEIMGTRKILCPFDPIEETIRNKGTVLFYLSKSKITRKSYLNIFSKYIDMCSDIEDERIEEYISKLKFYTGGDTVANKNYFSQMILMLRKGIVIHHGSLPLQSRIIIEQYTNDGLCRLCFATSTLEQGINMPFDVVYIDRLSSSKPLSVKNLIGRAGRSTVEPKFDFGYVILGSLSHISRFRSLMLSENELPVVSELETEDLENSDYSEFKNAILTNTLSDEFNLTQTQIEIIESKDAQSIIEEILSLVFSNGETFISLEEINASDENKLTIYQKFAELYELNLRRSLNFAERDVLNTAVKIILWRIHGKTFKNICWYRYSYASKTALRAQYEKAGRRTDRIEAAYYTAYNDLPDLHLQRYSLFRNVAAEDVDYDQIVCDTYDYIDKLIGYKLSDIYYAAFLKFYENTNDNRALRLAKYIRYGTDSERDIWMLRYGLTFEDIENLSEHISVINGEGIIFKDSIYSLSYEDIKPIERFM